MKLETTANIWHNGRLIPSDDANIHLLSHVVHYGSSIFEGIRCYSQPTQGEYAVPGAAIFRLHEHMKRFLDSATIYRMPIPFTAAELSNAVISLVETNGVCPCYIRPVALRGYGELGVNPIHCPLEVYIANFPFGKYFSGHHGADVCVSSWNRPAPNTMPSLAKAGGNYLNSQLIRMEAEINGYTEGIAVDTNGYLSEGAGENLFLVRNGILFTTPLADSILDGITRSSVLTIATDLGITIIEKTLPREFLYICDEAFLTGTAVEITHIRSVDRIMVGDGAMGPVTSSINKEFFALVSGVKPDRHHWLTSIHLTTEKSARG